MTPESNLRWLKHDVKRKGLVVVKRIVEIRHGTITFESEKGKGTTFTVTRPRRAERLV